MLKILNTAGYYFRLCLAFPLLLIAGVLLIILAFVLPEWVEWEDDA